MRKNHLESLTCALMAATREAIFFKLGIGVSIQRRSAPEYKNININIKMVHFHYILYLDYLPYFGGLHIIIVQIQRL